MNRRTFFQVVGPGAGMAAAGGRAMARWAGPANKRQRMLDWLAGKTDPNYTPAAFFLHFGEQYKNGLPAAKRHLEYFRQTDMDFVKIQFEQAYEQQAWLKRPADWTRLELKKIDFYEPLMVTVRELVKATKKDALILMTLYSPFMCAGQCAPAEVLKRHLEEDPEAVKRGLEILTESQMIFVRACIKEGVDGFYMSTQGAEAGRFANPKIFAGYIRPADLVSMKEIQARCAFNILHVCDYHMPYASYDAVTDYPGHVVNCNTQLKGRQMSPEELSKLFKRPYMGGLDRHGVLAKGTAAEVEAEIRRVIKSAPKQFLLAADCTVAGDTDWGGLRRAISVAHRVGR